MSTAEEVEVARRNLMAGLKAAQRKESVRVTLDTSMVGDLIEVLEASKPTVVDREAVKAILWQHQVGRHHPSDKALDGYRAVIADAVLAALYPKATEGAGS